MHPLHAGTLTWSDDALAVLYAIAAHDQRHALNTARDPAVGAGVTVTGAQLHDWLHQLDHAVSHGHPIITASAAAWTAGHLRESVPRDQKRLIGDAGVAWSAYRWSRLREGHAGGAEPALPAADPDPQHQTRRLGHGPT